MNCALVLSTLVTLKFTSINFQDIEQMAMEALHHYTTMEQRLDALDASNTESFANLQMAADKSLERLAEAEKKVAHFGKIALRMNKAVPREIKALNDKIASLELTMA